MHFLKRREPYDYPKEEFSIESEKFKSSLFFSSLGRKEPEIIN